MTDNPTVTDELIESANEETPTVVVAELLVEEVSIDGMCGVY